MKRNLVDLLLLLLCLSLSAVAGAEAQIPIGQTNLIDRNFAELNETAQATAERRLIAEAYLSAWQTELTHVAGSDAAQELAQLLESAYTYLP